jgi:ubiquinone/menaquinone biosynthesis C-methylase UbiE
MIPKNITPEQARKFYNRFGRLQDTQRFYEDSATNRLIELANFNLATNLLEFGCGTGHFAQRLFTSHLPATARYTGIDLSPKMLEISTARLNKWQNQLELKCGGVSLLSELPDHAYDRFISNYVLDLLSEKDIKSVLNEAHRLLTPDGLLGLVSLTFGTHPFSRLLTKSWQKVHQLNPVLLGGCRPIQLNQFLAAAQWQIQHNETQIAFGLASQLIVATPV